MQYITSAPHLAQALTSKSHSLPLIPHYPCKVVTRYTELCESERRLLPANRVRHGAAHGLCLAMKPLTHALLFWYVPPLSHSFSLSLYARHKMTLKILPLVRAEQNSHIGRCTVDSPLYRVICLHVVTHTSYAISLSFSIHPQPLSISLPHSHNTHTHNTHVQTHTHTTFSHTPSFSSCTTNLLGWDRI